MDSYIQLEHRRQDREKQKLGGLTGPFLATVQATNSSEDSALISYYAANKRPISIGHPFINSDSWIRAMPSSGAPFIAQMRSDNAKPAWLASYGLDTYKRIDAYNIGKSIYRTLKEGEIELTSAGWAGSFYSKRYQYDYRAGIIKGWLDQNLLEAGVKAPTHRRLLHYNTSSKIGDEERFGVVRRPSATNPAIESTFVKLNGAYCREHLINLSNFSGQTPAVLLDKREGHVIDNSGQPVKHQITNKNLRLSYTWWTKSNQQIIEQIDESGNILWSIPSEAQEGWQINITNGNYRVIAQKDIAHTSDDGSYVRTIKRDDTVVAQGNAVRNITKDYNLQAQSVKLVETTGQAELSLAGGKVALGIPSAELVDIVSQMNQILSQTTCPGFGALIDQAAQFAQLQAKVDSIKGSL